MPTRLGSRKRTYTLDRQKKARQRRKMFAGEYKKLPSSNKAELRMLADKAYKLWSKQHGNL